MASKGTQYVVHIFKRNFQIFKFDYFLLQEIQEMIVVDTTNQNRPVGLIDFYEIKGLTRSNVLSFEWKKDHGVINGTEGQINRINDIFNKSENLAFANFKIMRKWDYDHDKCTTKFQNPCPYYYTALSRCV